MDREEGTLRAKPIDPKTGKRPPGMEPAGGPMPQAPGEAHQGQPIVPVPPPMTDAEAALDASIRLKQDRGIPLDDDERTFLARLNADREVRYQ